MQKVSIYEASKDLLKLIEVAIKGEEVVITKDEQPIAKLVPFTPGKKTWPAQAGSAKGMVTISDDFDEPITDFEDYLQ
ncbi:type II toxin-antitoxin system Phd/YefM family antitoxin [Aerosakkonemataceae cyanobacterium BLCC-F154]|uniref:Type II toxin-antitoxin system Phd/YefM family antitoxin n=1 Tax=Floridaenema fluviatile BLCC-F154 TaxID=3153640 RepID=A0ABV4YH18_9CYAN